MKKSAKNLEDKFMKISGMNEYIQKTKPNYGLTYGGVLCDFELRGGLYNAIAVVLAPYYYEDGLEIEKFINNISDIRELTLNEIEDTKFDEIMNKFDNIIKKVKTENEVDWKGFAEHFWTNSNK